MSNDSNSVKNNRLENGKKILEQVDANSADIVLHTLDDIAPDVSRFILEFAFNDIYGRGTLDLKQRELITISSLLTQGDTAPELEVHINGSLNVGLTKKEIIEAFIQCSPYVGFPKVINALNVARKVFNK